MAAIKDMVDFKCMFEAFWQGNIRIICDGGHNLTSLPAS